MADTASPLPASKSVEPSPQPETNSTKEATEPAPAPLVEEKSPPTTPAKEPLRPLPRGLVESPTSPAPKVAPQSDPTAAPEVITAPEALPLPSIASESAPWQSPLDIAIHHDGTYFVADRKLPGIWRVKDGQTTTFYKGPTNPKAPMGAIRSLFVAADGSLFAGDAATKDVYSISPTGEIKSLARNSVGIPNSIAVVDRTVYVADIEQQKIWRFPAEGLGIAQQPTLFADVPGCRGLHIDELGFIWVVSTIQPQLRKYTGDGKFDPVFENVVFEFPQQVHVTIEGTAYVTDSSAKTVWKVERGGQPEKWLTDPHLSTPTRIVQQENHFFVSDAKANSVFRVSKDAAIELMINGSNTAPASTASAAGAAPALPATRTSTPN